MLKRSILFFMCALSLLASSMLYADMFSATIKVDGVTQAVSYHSISDLVDAFSDEHLQQLFPDYTDSSSVTAEDINLRGLSATVNYTGNTLRFTVPQAGISETFSGDSRDDAEQQLKDWFKGQGDSALTSLLHAFVSQTPYDPVAGNPDSMMAGVIKGAWGVGNSVWLSDESASSSAHFFSVSPSYGQHDVSGTQVKQLNLPLAYAYYFANGTTALFVQMPINVTREDHSDSYATGLSIAVQQNVLPSWSLTPVLGVNALASPDLGAAAISYSAFLKSTVFAPWHASNVRWGMNNMVGYLSTQSLHINGYDIDYDLNNVAYQNGLFTDVFFSTSMAFRVQASHTDVLGTSDWYIAHYNSVAFSLMRLGAAQGYQYARYHVGVSYDFSGSDYHGFMLSSGMVF
jgi:hypothetical protein